MLAPVYILAFYLCYRTLSTPSPMTPTSSELPPKTGSSRMAMQQKIVERNHSRQVRQVETGPNTSFFLIWLLATALSLITAPLVEPRYFLIPWVMWRLHVPSWSPTSSLGGRKGGKKMGMLDVVGFWAWKGYDYRYWIETAWFLGINAVTGYVFLYRGFEWTQEPGKVQRFMW